MTINPEKDFAQHVKVRLIEELPCVLPPTIDITVGAEIVPEHMEGRAYKYFCTLQIGAHTQVVRRNDNEAAKRVAAYLKHHMYAQTRRDLEDVLMELTSIGVGRLYHDPTQPTVFDMVSKICKSLSP